MAHNLTRHAAGLGQAQTVHYVVQTAFQEHQHVFAGNALHVGSGIKVVTELLFQHAVDEAHLLLFL